MWHFIKIQAPPTKFAFFWSQWEWVYYPKSTIIVQFFLQFRTNLQKICRRISQTFVIINNFCTNVYVLIKHNYHFTYLSLQMFSFSEKENCRNRNALFKSFFTISPLSTLIEKKMQNNITCSILKSNAMLNANIMY